MAAEYVRKRDEDGQGYSSGRYAQRSTLSLADTTFRDDGSGNIVNHKFGRLERGPLQRGVFEAWHLERRLSIGPGNVGVMSSPNFFILGAPKCGTTSLAAWLSTHPHVYMSPLKEPHYYNTDLGNRFTQSSSEYRRLFRGVTSEHIAVGEASVFYLYSREAVPNILDEIPEARFVVCLRDPVQMVASLHQQLVVAAYEDVTDLKDAWDLQGERRQRRRVSRFCYDAQLLLYGPVCSLGEQMRRLYRLVSPNRVLPILLDDMRQDPWQAYRSVLDFLNVEPDDRDTFPVINEAKELRFPLVRKLLSAYSLARQRLHIPRFRTGIMKMVAEANHRPKPRSAISPEMTRMLASYFASDVQLLRQLLKRDLAGWNHV